MAPAACAEMARLLVMDEVNDYMPYSTGIVTKIDQAMSHHDALMDHADSGQIRLDLIRAYLARTSLVPLARIRDSEQTLWLRPEHLRERYERQHADGPHVTLIEREVRWYGVIKYGPRVEDMAATPELLHEFCEENDIRALELDLLAVMKYCPN